MHQASNLVGKKRLTGFEAFRSSSWGHMSGVLPRKKYCDFGVSSRGEEGYLSVLWLMVYDMSV